MREDSSNINMHLDTTSLDFKNANNVVESTFSKVETKTDNIYANNSINIGNLNIIKLDDKGLNVMKYIHLSHLDLEQEIIKRRQTNI